MKSTQESDNELKSAYKAEKELNHLAKDKRISAIMQFIENERIKKCKKHKRYTQTEIAKKAGFCRTTYKNYLYGNSDGLTITALFKILQELQIKHFDISKFMNL